MSTEDTFADRLAWLLDKSGCGSRKLGQLTGLSHAYASVTIGRGGNEPALYVLNKIAELFGVSVLWLGLGQGARPKASEVKRAYEKAAARKAA